MPTGYTAQLESMDFDVHKWLSEGVSRAFGMCISLRDENGDMSAKEIEEHLKKQGDDSYYVERVQKAQEDYDKSLKLSDVDWERKNTARYDKELEGYEKKMKEVEEVKMPNYNKSMEKLRTLKKKAHDCENEIAENVIDFGIQQLESVESEFNGKYVSKPKGIETKEYKKMMIGMYKKDIEYYTKRKLENTNREDERLEAYQDFNKFLEENK